MPTFRLVATSQRSQAFHGGADGGSNLALSSGRPLNIGRAPGNDVQLPPDWIQISSKHCIVSFSPEQVST
jgi:hypothetical protein